MRKEISELADYLYEITVHDGVERAENGVTCTKEGHEVAKEYNALRDKLSAVLREHNLKESNGNIIDLAELDRDAADASNDFHTMVEDACFKEGLRVGLKTVDLVLSSFLR
jgi:hypothetical protein